MAFLAPGFIVYVVFVLAPICLSIRYSFTSWDGINPAHWTGVANYARALRDPIFAKSLTNVGKLALWFAVLPIVVGLLVTFAVARARVKGVGLFRTVIFLPYVLSTIVVAAAWRWIYEPVFGPLNLVLSKIGFGDFSHAWLYDFTTARPAVGVIGTWSYFGFVSVLLIAGAQKIDDALYDAAALDGASAWTQFWHVTLPGIRNELTFVFVIMLITALRIFDVVFVLTKGGPGYETYTVGLLIYKEAFERGEPGYAASLAVILSLITLATAVVVLGLREREGDAR